jgi:fructokinase
MSVSRIYAVGETILDIIFRDGHPMAARPGGSSFNASITLGRLGAPVTFISEMGNDRVGDMIGDFMEANGVDTGSVARYEDGQSAIALAFLNEKSDAEYQFYKDYPHQRLNVEFPRFRANDLLMFGSFYALNPGIRTRVRTLLEMAADSGATLVYDPNFRSTHLPDREELLSVIRENMDLATIVRASDEDCIHIFDVDNADDAWDQVRNHCPVMIYTANTHGVHLRTQSLDIYEKVERIEPVSTVGAGDTFNAGLLYGIFRRGYTKEQLGTLGGEEWSEMIRQAIAFSREVCLSYDNYLPVEYANRVRAELD